MAQLHGAQTPGNSLETDALAGRPAGWLAG